MTTSMDVGTPPRPVGAAAADPPPHPVPVPPADAPVAAWLPITAVHSRQSAVWLEAIKPKMRVNIRREREYAVYVLEQDRVRSEL